MAHITELQSASKVLKFTQLSVFSQSIIAVASRYSRSGHPCSWRLIDFCSRGLSNVLECRWCMCAFVEWGSEFTNDVLTEGLIWTQG